ncbi:MAG: hypothetical protein FWF87_06970 [Synergistaceae bacterium]|nr:hypothetical protein [Synergistaceae bacterium]
MKFKTVFFLLLVFSFAAPVHAYVGWDDLIDVDEWNAQESLKATLERNAEIEAQRKEAGDGKMSAMFLRPARNYEFGRSQGANTPTLTAYPESARLGIEYFTFDGKNAYESDVGKWFKTPAFRYNDNPEDVAVINALGLRGHNKSEDLRGNMAYLTTNEEIKIWFKHLQETYPQRMRHQVITGFPFYSNPTSTSGGLNVGRENNPYVLERTFEMLIAVFSNNTNAKEPIAPVFTPEQVKRLGKPVVWLHGQIHGEETSAAESLLQEAADYARGGKRGGTATEKWSGTNEEVDFDAILDQVTIVIVPRFNVDGAWDVHRGTTGVARFGHAGQVITAVTSGNNSGFDPNRDFLGVEAPIVRQVRQMWIAYDPIASVCKHEMGFPMDNEQAPNAAGTGFTNTNYARGYLTPVQSGMLSHHNIDQRVRDLARFVYEPAIAKKLTDKKIGWQWYRTFSGTNTIIPNVEVVSRDGVTGPVMGQISVPGMTTDDGHPDEGIGTNMGISNQSVSFLFEGVNPQHASTIRLNYMRRAYAHYLASLAVAQTAATRKDEIMSVIEAARETEIQMTRPLVSSTAGSAPVKDDIFNVIEYKSWQKFYPPESRDYMQLGTRAITSRRGFDTLPHPTLQTTRPTAYIIPKEHHRAAMRLFYTGVKLERLLQDTDLEVEAYTVNDISEANLPAQMYYSITPTVANPMVTKTTKTVHFQKDDFVVRMDQLGASMAAMAIEPYGRRNFGGYFLSRKTSGSIIQRASGTYTVRAANSLIPWWYHTWFLPVEVGKDFPAYRYVKTEKLATYSARMNLPFMLTAVDMVHSPTQGEVEEIRVKMGLTVAPEYVSILELPVLSTDNYKNKPAPTDTPTWLAGKTEDGLTVTEHLFTGAFLDPDGKRIDISPEFIVRDAIFYEHPTIPASNDTYLRDLVTIVAPKGLTGNVFLKRNDGEFIKVRAVEEPKPDPDCKEDLKAWWEEYGCNAGIPLLTVLALAGLMFRRK